MLKLISLNIELNKHFERSIPFLKNESADVICLQEVFENDLEEIKSELGCEYSVFLPMSYIAYKDGCGDRAMNDHYTIADKIALKEIESSKYVMGITGIAILSKTPIMNSYIYYYLPLKDNEIHIHNSHDRRNTEGRGIICVRVAQENKIYTITNTHFTWTPKGEPDDGQRTDLNNMMKYLNIVGEYILCGDFNAPRGGEIFSELSKNLHDNIPQEVTSTLDPVYHSAKGIELVVDGLFTTSQYKVKEIQIIEGVSDHKAIVAIIDTI